MSAVLLEPVTRREFDPAIEPRQQYGVIPWRTDKSGQLRVMLVTSRGRGRWIVPKGWPEQDRAPYLSAAMEAFEEAGVIGEVLPRPLASFDYVTENDEFVDEQRLVTLFSMRVVGTLTNWPERHQRKRRWFSLADAARTADDPGLARIICAVGDDPGILKRGRAVRSGEAALEQAAMPG